MVVTTTAGDDDGRGPVRGEVSPIRSEGQRCFRGLSVAPGPAVVVEPGTDLVGVEAQEVSPLDEGDAAFVDEAADVTGFHTEDLGDLGHGQKLRERRAGRGHGAGIPSGVARVR